MPETDAADPRSPDHRTRKPGPDKAAGSSAAAGSGAAEPGADGITAAADSHMVRARSDDGVTTLVRQTADAWRTCLSRHMTLDGFLCLMQGDHGLESILEDGNLVPLAQEARQAGRITAAFPDENELWQGTAAELSARLGGPLAIPANQRIVLNALYANGRFVGLIAVAVAEPITPVGLEECISTFVAAATVAAMFHEHETQRAQADALLALDAISQALSRETDPRSLYSVIHREVSKVVECDAFYVCLHDGSDVVEYVYRYDQGTFVPRGVVRLSGGPTSYCLRERKPFVLTPENTPMHQSGMYLGQKRRSQSAIHVPMLVDGEPIGVISAQSYRPDAYQEAHVRMLAIIAAKAATAVRNTQLLDQVRSQVENLHTLMRALQIHDLTLGRVDDVVVTVDLEGRITAHNEALTRILGYGPTELIGRPVISLRTSGRGSFPSFQHARNRRITLTAKDGRQIPIVYSTEALTEDGKVVGYLTIGRDLTDLQRSEEAGREALALERQRISRDLHDGLIQSLSIAKMQLQILQRECSEACNLRELAELQETLSRGLAEARHYIVELKHAHIGQEGLVSAARRYARELGRVSGLSIGVSSDTETSPLSDTDEVQLFYILSEALNNVRKHSKAKRVRVAFRVLRSAFRMSIEDDGRGFDPAALPPGTHWGIQHIRERASALGGSADISSTHGSGTRVSMTVPLAPERAGDRVRERLREHSGERPGEHASERSGEHASERSGERAHNRSGEGDRGPAGRGKTP